MTLTNGRLKEYCSRDTDFLKYCCMKKSLTVLFSVINILCKYSIEMFVNKNTLVGDLMLEGKVSWYKYFQNMY